MRRYVHLSAVQGPSVSLLDFVRRIEMVRRLLNNGKPLLFNQLNLGGTNGNPFTKETDRNSLIIPCVCSRCRERSEAIRACSSGNS
jgi:hypothetical protein